MPVILAAHAGDLFFLIHVLLAEFIISQAGVD
jgi:hypothetical protein